MSRPKGLKGRGPPRQPSKIVPTKRLRDATWSDVAPPQTLTPLIITVGSVLIKIVDAFDRVDFLLSFEDSQVASIFQFFVDYSLIFAAVGAIAWWALAKFGKPPKHVGVAPFFAVGVVSFVVGTLVAKSFANEARLIDSNAFYRSIGNNPMPYCHGVIATSRLREYAADYRLVYVCGPVDSATDFMIDDRVTISEPRSIVEDQMTVTVFLEEEKRYLQQLPAWWFQVALVPRNVFPEQYVSLNQIEAVGGLLVGTRPSQSVSAAFRSN